MQYIEQLEDLKIQEFGFLKKYFCEVRKSFIPATPEEKVRQNFLKYLINEVKIPINRIKVEESLSHHGKGNRRIDILILDNENLPFIIYECKKENEYLTDEVLAQAFDYFEKLNTVEYLGIVIGNDLNLIKYEDNAEKPFISIDQPNYSTLINGGEISVIEDVKNDYKRNNWEKPIDEKIIEELIDYGIVGKDTDSKYHSFLVNFDGWLLNENDKINSIDNIEDIGLKFTKFGSVGGGFFAHEYRSFLVKNHNDKPIVCISLSSMKSGDNSPIRTTIFVGIETINDKNSALQIQVENSVTISNNKIFIEHNGVITIGKYGAAKKNELINFVLEKKPELVVNGKVFLGIINENEEINSSNISHLIRNIIEYALLRNEFRKLKKKQYL